LLLLLLLLLIQVISNAGIFNTCSRLLPSDVSSQPIIQQQLSAAKAIGPSISASVLYLGIKGALVPEFAGIGNIHKHHSADMDGDFERHMADASAPMPCVFMSCCDSREKMSFAGSSSSSNSSNSSNSSSGSGGGGSSRPQVSTLQVATVGHFEAFEPWAGSEWRKRGDDYKEQKQQLQERLMEQLGKFTQKFV
jgi:all-trans-retinol 13,14-reductase